MIRNVFLPEKIKGSYLFPQRILGIDIEVKTIVATKCYVYGKSILIEEIYTQELDSKLSSHKEQIAKALKELIRKVGKFDKIHTAFSSSYVTFRELTLPFAKRDKIVQVLQYEIEQKLPFPPEQAILDFIITEQIGENTTVMVGATQRHYINEHLALFEDAGLVPERIIIDLFATYSMTQLLPYKNDTYIFMDIGSTNTHLAYVEKGKLNAIRTLKQGINEDFMNNLQFTIDLFKKKNKKAKLNKLIILERGNSIKNLASDMQKKMSLKAELLSVDLLIKNGFFTSPSHKKINPQALLSLSVAAPLPGTEYSNLRQKEFVLPNTRLFTKQFFSAVFLFIMTITSLVSVSSIYTNRLKTSIRKSEQELRSDVQKALGIEENNIAELVRKSRTSVDTQTKIWFAFSQSTRSSLLGYLQKLSSKIDKDSIGLNLSKLNLSHDTITIQGEVKDISSVITLEEELKQANLGSFVSPQEPLFDITISLKKEVEVT